MGKSDAKYYKELKSKLMAGYFEKEQQKSKQSPAPTRPKLVSKSQQRNQSVMSKPLAMPKLQPLVANGFNLSNRVPPVRERTKTPVALRRTAFSKLRGTIAEHGCSPMSKAILSNTPAADFSDAFKKQEKVISTLMGSPLSGTKASPLSGIKKKPTLQFHKNVE